MSDLFKWDIIYGDTLVTVSEQLKEDVSLLIYQLLRISKEDLAKGVSFSEGSFEDVILRNIVEVVSEDPSVKESVKASQGGDVSAINVSVNKSACKCDRCKKGQMAGREPLIKISFNGRDQFINSRLIAMAFGESFFYAKENGASVEQIMEIVEAFMKIDSIIMSLDKE